MHHFLCNTALFLLLSGLPAYAGEWSLDFKGGVGVPIRTTPDGTYWQSAFEHNTKPLTGMWGVGLDYKLNSEVAIQIHYLDLGSSRIKGRATSDENYDQYQGRCIQNCSFTYGYRATDSLRGGDITLSYTWRQRDIQPFVKGGVALLYHKAIFRNQWGDEDRFNGWVPEIEMGGGVKYKQAYLELDYFQGVNFGGMNLPISTQQIAVFVGVNIVVF